MLFRRVYVCKTEGVNEFFLITFHFLIDNLKTFEKRVINPMVGRGEGDSPRVRYGNQNSTIREYLTLVIRKYLGTFGIQNPESR